MSEFTLTPNLGLYKPRVDGDDDAWGDHLNLNADKLDSVLSTSSGLFLPLAGGEMTGQLLLTGLAPTDDAEAVSLGYLEDYALPLAGGTMQGPLHLAPGAPPAADEAVPKSYVDAQNAAQAGNFVAKTGDTMSGDLTINKAEPGLWLESAGIQNRYIAGTRNGAMRWGLFLGSAEAETGDNAGSPFAINSYSDAGTYLASPIIIRRTTHRVEINNGMDINGGANVSGRLYVYGSDSAELHGGGGYGILRFNNNWRRWWIGADGGDGGNFNFHDDSAGRRVLQLDTGGNVVVSNGIYANYVRSYGWMEANGVLKSLGGRVVAQYPGNNPSVAAHASGYAACGFWCQTDGTMAFGWTDGDGTPLEGRFYVERGGNVSAVGSVYAGYLYSYGAIGLAGRITCNEIMNTTGVFRVANNDAYYLQRSSGDGHWYFVDNWVTNFTVYNWGQIYARGEVTSAGNMRPQNTDFILGGGGSGRLCQFAGNWYWDWNINNGTLAWQTPSGWGMILYGDRNVNIAGWLAVQNSYIHCQAGCAGVKYQAGSYNSGHGFLFGWSNYVSGCPTISVDNGGAVIPLANALSDERIKTDIQPSRLDALDIANRIPLVEYDWLDIHDPYALKQARRRNRKSKLTERRRVGMVAQQVRKIFPEAVIVGDEGPNTLGRIWSIDTNTMLALLIKSVQQLTDRIEELEAA